MAAPRPRPGSAKAEGEEEEAQRAVCEPKTRRAFAAELGEAIEEDEEAEASALVVGSGEMPSPPLLSSFVGCGPQLH
jgi:hypothetical protein